MSVAFKHISAMSKPSLKPSPAMTQHFSPDAAVLTEIFDPQVNLVVWQRPFAPMVADYCDWLVLQATLHSTPAFRPIQQIIEPDTLPTLLQQQLPDAIGKTQFIDDLQLVSQMLACLMDCTTVGFRLKPLNQPMCPRFHTDHVALRLLVTYAGAGTEWLGHPPQNTAQHQHIPASGQIATQHVALLKGSAWDGNEQGAIFHRSPAALHRILLSIDPAD